MTKSSLFVRGMVAAAPVVLGYACIGAACGAISATAGLSTVEVLTMSLLVYAGSAQFLMAAMLLSPISTIIFNVFLINFRHFLLATALAPRLTALAWWQRLLIGATMTDETFAVSINRLEEKATEVPDDKWNWLLGLNCSAYLSWVVGNTVGAALAEQLAGIPQHGLEFALSAMFIGLVAGQVARYERKLPCLISIVSAAGSALLLQRAIGDALAVTIAAIVGATAAHTVRVRMSGHD